MTEKIKIAVIGGGAAGLFAACRAASPFCEITLYEKNPSLGRKLSITGKGRCNLTNNTTIDKVIENIPTNPKFLYTALNRFSPADTMDFFEELGVPLKTERGGRVFPVSDRAGDIVAALSECLHRCGTNIVHKRVESLIIRDGVACGLIAEKQEYDYDRIIVCTGGRSYPRTGSTGDGYRFAKDAGISVTACSPSLVPIETEDAWCRSVAGLSLKNVSLHIIDKTTGKSIYRDFGEMLFTHFGVSGPMILSASSHLRSMARGRSQAVSDL